MFGKTNDPVFPPHSQRLQSKDAKAVTAYITHVYHQHFLAYTLFQRATSLLCNETPNNPEAECINQEITRGCLHSENQCWNWRSDRWHLELHHLKVTKSVLCQYRSCLWHNLLVSCLLQRAVEVGLSIPPSTHLSKEIKALSNANTSMHTDSRKTRRDSLLHYANISEELQQKTVLLGRS